MHKSCLVQIIMYISCAECEQCIRLAERPACLREANCKEESASNRAAVCSEPDHRIVVAACKYIATRLLWWVSSYIIALIVVMTGRSVLKMSSRRERHSRQQHKPTPEVGESAPASGESESRSVASGAASDSGKHSPPPSGGAASGGNEAVTAMDVVKSGRALRTVLHSSRQQYMNAAEKRKQQTVFT